MSMLLWSQYWRWATPRNTGVQAAVPRRWSHFSRGYSNASLTGGVLHPHRMAPLPKDKLFAKVEAYRAQLERQLRRAQWDSVRPVGAGGQPASDRYGVRPSGRKPARFAPPKQLLAKAIALRMSMLTRDTEPFKRMGYSQYFPATEFYANRFNSCALVSSAGSMLGSKLGPEIDGHETVVRFNDAPTAGFEGDWVEHPEFDLFPAYWLRREVLPDEPFYLMHPDSVWEAWHFLDSENPGPCAQEPTIQRISRACHYYEVHEDLGCTMGDWHPLAAEKLLALHLASSSVHALEQVFARGTLPLSMIDNQAD
ncbi:hypothetical protein MRX96_010114 [Rhipicephalus microplus]